MSRILVKRFTKNTRGRDIIVGDIHGTYTKLLRQLKEIGFNATSGDRLFSVGDLVDRGPESIKFLKFMKQDWFHAVAGNHDDMAWRWPNGHMDRYVYESNGGAWMIALDKETQYEVSAIMGALPVAIELETEHGLIGIVHATCSFSSWFDLTANLENENLSKNKKDAIIDLIQWDRSIYPNPVQGVRAVVVGHTPKTNIEVIGNHIYIDTMGWRGGEFTLLDANTLQPAEKVKK